MVSKALRKQSDEDMGRNIEVRQSQFEAQDWSELNRHDEVAVTEPGGRKYLASVDVKTADSHVVWVVETEGTRKAFDYRQGTTLVLVTPRP